MSAKFIQITIIFLIQLAIFIAIAISFVKTYKKRRQLLQGLSAQFSGKASALLLPYFTGEYQGLRFSLMLTTGRHSASKSLLLTLEKPCGFSLRVYRETLFTRLAEQLRFIKEVKTLDKSFDREFLIFSNTPDRARVYLSNTDTKEALRGLFQKGFSVFTVTSKSLILQKNNYSDEEARPENIKELLQQLLRLSRGA